MGKDYKRNGFSTGQGLNLSDEVADTHHGSLNAMGMKCPVCGKKAAGYRPEGYYHPGLRPGKETTYCKISNERGRDGKGK